MNQKQKLIKNSKGFGFLSMVILIAVIAAVGSIVLVTLDSTTSNQQFAETAEKMDILIDAIEKYQADTGIDPATLNDLVTDAAGVGACSANTATSEMENWCGPYIDLVFQEDLSDFSRDGWGTAFNYNVGADNTPGNGTLTSYGADKVSGGGDDLTRSF
ncbi:MAG: type II secretion system protein GspG [Bdellovibrionales bacterium]